ncbi:YbhB/YbcL family Raf kinase inhibitor-like protein [Enterococcus termitis]|nr:YbhB/YbcL family Raf kinase inhibitor-like protein [Enterococcus termitis]OJG97529.1 phosphatidylethanolamine-binding protein [Enterococcus termitis]
MKTQKKWLLLFLAGFTLLLVSACTSKEAGNNENEKQSVNTEMKVSSTGLTDGVWQDKYGKRGHQFNKNDIPNYSIPFKIEHAPKGTKTYAVILEDKDAYAVTNGISWIHWLAANITKNELLENESKSATDFVQGANSWMTIEGGKQSRELSSFYGGMAPPDKLHTYELHVFALDTALDLENGFTLNDLYWKMESHILDSYILKGTYAN